MNLIDNFCAGSPCLTTSFYVFILILESECEPLWTNSYQSEGKSYTSSNLAVSFAQAGKSVLLVDCDLRRPKIGRLMGLRSQAGLSNVLVKPQLFEAAAVPTAVPGLHVMLSGTIPPNPSELLGSQRMQEFLKEARRHFEYIILDTSPVNMVSDAVMLSSFSDGVLFVVRAGSTDRRNVSRALEQFRYVNARVLGLVLNGAGSTGKSGYHRYQGVYAYKQGEK